MTRRLLLRRSRVTSVREQRAEQASTEQVSRLVALASALADRMEAMPSAGLDRDRDRRDRVRILRRAAEAGRRHLDAREGRSDSGGQTRRVQNRAGG